jgi:hypothetical protein
MFKIFFIVSLLFILSNCGAPGTALLGPAFTGATTKSFARAGISYGSNQIIKKIDRKSVNQQN